MLPPLVWVLQTLSGVSIIFTSVSLTNSWPRMVPSWTRSRTSASYPKTSTPLLWRHHWALRGRWRSRRGDNLANTSSYRPSAQRSRYREGPNVLVARCSLFCVFDAVFPTFCLYVKLSESLQQWQQPISALHDCNSSLFQCYTHGN